MCSLALDLGKVLFVYMQEVDISSGRTTELKGRIYWMTIRESYCPGTKLEAWNTRSWPMAAEISMVITAEKAIIKAVLTHSPMSTCTNMIKQKQVWKSGLA